MKQHETFPESSPSSEATVARQQPGEESSGQKLHADSAIKTGAEAAALNGRDQTDHDTAGTSWSYSDGEQPIPDGHSALRPRETRRKIPRWVGTVVATAIIAIAAILAYRILFQKPVNDSATDTSDPQTTGVNLAPDQLSGLTIEVVQRHTVQGELKSTGKVALNNSLVTPVLPQFAGRLVKVSAELNSQVHAGQVLAVIETPDIIGPQGDFQQALGNLRTAHTSLDLAKRTRERSERLVKVEAIPVRDFQQAQTDEKHAEEDLQRAEQAVAAARGRLQTLGFKESEIKVLETGGKILNRQVSMVAPISGTVIDRKAGLGQVVQPGGDPLFQIANLSTVWVNAEIYEDQLARIRIGSPAVIETPAYPNDQFPAQVDQIGSMVDPDKRTLPVRCVMSSAGGKLKPGMFVNVSLGGPSNLDAITVPTSAVVTSGDQRFVYVETELGHFDRREVTLGSERDGSVVIRSGLNEGERVVTKGSLLLSDQGDNKGS